MAKWEEAREFPPLVLWGILTLSSVVTLLFGVAVFLLVPDRPRHWNMGALPDTPGESIYSSERTPTQVPGPRQLAPLPEARPWDAGVRP